MNVADILQYIDSLKRQYGGTLSDIAADPRKGLLGVGDRLNQGARDWNRDMMSQMGGLLSVRPEVQEQSMEGLLGTLPMSSGVGQITRASAEALAPKRSRRVVGTTGQYVGAPPGIDSPQKLGAVVHNYVNNVKAGIPGREFYRSSSDDVWQRSGHNEDLADLFTQNLAQLSRSNNVAGNTTMSTRAHTQAMTGEPVWSGRFPSKDSPPLQAMYDSGVVEYAGHKRDPFATQLGVRWAPQRVGRGVNDMHEAEIMGYPSGKVGGETQHSWMDEVRDRAIKILNKEKVGGFDDWDTGTAQAAAWTGNKIRRGEVLPGDAAKDYAHFLPRMEANATWESLPGTGTGHLGGLLDADFATKSRFHNNPAGSWDTSASGRDIGYTAAGLMPGSSVSAVGRFNNEVNPATVARPLTGLLATATGGNTLTTGSKNALNAVEAARSYFDVQNAGAWHKVVKAGNADEYTAAGIPIEGMSEEVMKKLAPILEEKGYWLASAPNGITVMANEGTAKGKDFAKEVKALLKASGVKHGDVNLGRLENGYIDYSAGWPAGKGAVTKQMLEELGNSPKVMKALEDSPGYRATVEARNARDIAAQAEGYGVARQDVLRARTIFAKEGWEGLRKAAELGIVPAVLLTVTGGLLGSNDQQ